MPVKGVPERRRAPPDRFRRSVLGNWSRSTRCFPFSGSPGYGRPLPVPPSDFDCRFSCPYAYPRLNDLSAENRQCFRLLQQIIFGSILKFSGTLPIAGVKTMDAISVLWIQPRQTVEISQLPTPPPGWKVDFLVSGGRVP